MLEIGDRLFLAGYTLPAPIMAYDPSVEFNMGWSPLRNPRLFAWPGWMSTWRPISFLSAPNGKAYIGAIAGYGLLESPLFEVDPVSLQVRQYPIATDQSIASLTNIGNLIIGGTSILGGSGSHPTQKTGELFLWDANTHQKIYSTLPVSGTTNVSNLLAAPNGMVYGIAEDGVAQRLFVFDPQERKVISTTTVNAK